MPMWVCKRGQIHWPSFSLYTCRELRTFQPQVSGIDADSNNRNQWECFINFSELDQLKYHRLDNLKHSLVGSKTTF